MELPGYNTMDPYPHMNERCPSMPPKYSRPVGCWKTIMPLVLSQVHTVLVLDVLDCIIYASLYIYIYARTLYITCNAKSVWRCQMLSANTSEAMLQALWLYCTNASETILLAIDLND